MKPTNFIDEDIIREIIFQNSLYLIKLLIISYFLFYWIPKRLFPQPKTTFTIEVIVINMIYMVAYVEIFVTLFVFLKIFSIVIFIIFMIFTKLFFIKFYEKKDPLEEMNKLRVATMIYVLDIIDNPKTFFHRVSVKTNEKIIFFQQHITFYNVLKFLLYLSVVGYIFVNTMARGLQTVSYSIADTAQFVDWVNHLQNNVLYSDYQVGADFYGISILIFFVNTFTNIDVAILFSVYPALLWIALYLAIFFVLKDFTKSDLVAIFAVIVHGFFLMSPLATYVVGASLSTNNPHIEHFLNFSFYAPTKEQLKYVLYFDFTSYYRYMTAMAYEHSSVFVLLNAYFLIKALEFKTNKYLILYALTLFLVFTFHGGGAIPLVIISILIAINSVLFLKLDWKIFKKGLLAILFGAILGNMWVLSMLKFGIPQDFGAAAPFLDKFFQTKEYASKVAENGIFHISFICLDYVQYALFILFIIHFVIMFFRRDRFVNTSFMLIILGIFIVYFGPTFGFPNLAAISRLVEYFFFAFTLLMAISFFYIYKILPKIILVILLQLIVIISILTIPKWINTKKVFNLINQTEWSEIPEFILKINKENLKFTWTVVSYVQDFSKVKNKGYHINTSEFIMTYSPLDKYLRVPTPKVYIVSEDFTNPYTAMNEWYYRWRSKIESNLRAWIATYSMYHDNIKIAYRSKLVTIYEIDNREYMKLVKIRNKK